MGVATIIVLKMNYYSRGLLAMRELPSGSDIEAALTRVGELLDADGAAFAIVILGGAALNLLGVRDQDDD